MRVGTRDIFIDLAHAKKDHPHACGDKTIATFFDNIVRGSSPCVWGQVHAFALLCSSSRIIPMRVGTSINTELSGK